MADSYMEWDAIIKDMKVIDDNPVVGLADTNDEAVRMQNIISNEIASTTTIQKDGRYFVVRCCRKLTGDQTEFLRWLLYGAYAAYRMGPKRG